MTRITPLIASLIMMLSSVLYAENAGLGDNYLTDEFTTVEEYTLANGLRVTQKANDNGNNVSIRLKVNYGTRDERCGSREKAHFLEHLMFAGTSRYTETELDRMVSAWGGTWNAGTYNDMTVYEIDVHGKFQNDALEVLHHILTDSKITEESVNTSRDIIHRESGGKPSAIKRWAYRQGLFHSSAELAQEDRDPEHCRELEDALTITRQQLLDAHQTWYIPNNMHLFVVGSIEPDLRQRIETIFGAMQPQPLPSRLNQKLLPYPKQEYRSRLFKIHDDQSHIGIRYLITNARENTEYVAALLESWWQEKLFEYVRTERGLSYSPSVTLAFYEDEKHFRVAIDVNNSDIEAGLQALRAFDQEVMRQPMTQEDLDRIRMQGLISFSMEEMSNSGYADMFLYSLYESETWGRYLDPEDQYRSITVDDVNRFMQDHIEPQVIVFISEPEMDTATFMILIISLPLLLVAIIAWLVWRKFVLKKVVSSAE